MHRPVHAVLLGLICVAAPAAEAGLGIFEHGAGIKSLGFGGVTYATADETTAIAGNPAHLSSIGSRYDIGVDAIRPMATARLEGNAAGTDDRYVNDGLRYVLIPQLGIAYALDEHWNVGITVINAGLGPDYARSPYERFGGAPRASLKFASSGISTALSYKLAPDQTIGASLNLGYQVLEIKGMAFLGALSQTPEKVSNQGKDGAFSIGFSVGWRGQLTPQFSAGVGYRSKNWTQKHEDYRGLLPNRGSLELPAIWGAGVAWSPAPTWTLALEYQRYENEAETAFSNGIAKLDEGKPLGARDGPGFGFVDQNVYRLGVAWQATSALTLRAGYIDANQMMQESETLFGFLAALTSTRHYTVGASYDRGDWEVTGFFAHAPEQSVHGRESIQPAFGGGEAIAAFEVYALGISVGRRF